MEKIVLSEQTLSNLIREIETSLLSRHVFREGFITGQEILKFAPHKQINNFILFQIYQDWNAHIQNFRHPYFNFDHEEVNEGLTRFLNTLSRHIRISEQEFRPMLEKAIYNTLKLILNPKEVFNKFFFLNQDRIPIALFQKHAPYFSDYDFVIQSILKFYNKNQVPVVEKAVFFEKMDKVITIFESRENNSIEKYRNYLFNKATGKDLDRIAPKIEEQAVSQAPTPIKRESPTPTRPKTELRNPNQPASLSPRPKPQEPVQPKSVPPTSEPRETKSEPKAELRSEPKVELRSEPSVNSPQRPIAPAKVEITQPKPEQAPVRPETAAGLVKPQTGPKETASPQTQEKKQLTQPDQPSLRPETMAGILPPKEEKVNPKQDEQPSIHQQIRKEEPSLHERLAKKTEAKTIADSFAKKTEAPSVVKKQEAEKEIAPSVTPQPEPEQSEAKPAPEAKVPAPPANEEKKAPEISQEPEAKQVPEAKTLPVSPQIETKEETASPQPPVSEAKTPSEDNKPKSIHEVLAERRAKAGNTPSIAERISQEQKMHPSVVDSFVQKEETPAENPPPSQPEDSIKEETTKASDEAEAVDIAAALVWDQDKISEPKKEAHQEAPQAEKSSEAENVGEEKAAQPFEMSGLSFQTPTSAEEKSEIETVVSEKEQPLKTPEPDPKATTSSPLSEAETPETKIEEDSEPEEKAAPKGFDLFSPPPEDEPLSLFSDSQSTTLGQKFQTEERPAALHESLAPKKSIKIEHIPVHKQFQFVQKLFGGQSVKFRVVLDKLNETNSYREAEEVMDKYVFNSPSTRRTDKLSQEFIMLVKNRFEA